MHVRESAGVWVQVISLHTLCPVGGLHVRESAGVWVQVISLRGLDKQLLLSRQFKYSRYYLKLHLLRMKTLNQTRKFITELIAEILLSQHNPLPV